MQGTLLNQLGNKSITPLWIIALFVSLSETVLGIAVTQTSGSIQLMLTIFVISFPSIISGVFFFILWNRPEVLYSPTEYGKETDVSSFVEAIRRKPTDQQKLYSDIKNVIDETTEQIKVELFEIKNKSNVSQREEEINNILNTAKEHAVDKIRELAFLTFDSRPLLGNEGKVWQLPYDKYSTIAELLDNIWYSLKYIPPSTYDIKWVLRDKETDFLFRDMGYNWAKKHSLSTDIRSLHEVDIRPGMTFEIVKP